MKIYDFNKYKDSGKIADTRDCYYKSVLLDNQLWFLRIPRKSRRKDNSPVSLYIGSQIYKLVGVPAQEILIGEDDGYLVIACKDFSNNWEWHFAEFTGIKNIPIEDSISHSIHIRGENNLSNIENIKIIMSANRIFKKLPELKEHFWNIYVIDAFIGNKRRSFRDWGMLYNQKTDSIKLAPAFDNSCSIEVDSIKEEVEELINDRNLTGDEDCIKALLRIFPKIDLDKIKEMINDIPTSHNGLEIISEEKKQKLIECLEYKYEKGLKLIYNLHHDHQIEKEIADEIFFNEEF